MRATILGFAVLIAAGVLAALATAALHLPDPVRLGTEGFVYLYLGYRVGVAGERSRQGLPIASTKVGDA